MLQLLGRVIGRVCAGIVCDDQVSILVCHVYSPKFAIRLQRARLSNLLRMSIGRSKNINHAARA
jgi:hypothetical protein